MVLQLDNHSFTLGRFLVKRSHLVVCGPGQSLATKQLNLSLSFLLFTYLICLVQKQETGLQQGLFGSGLSNLKSIEIKRMCTRGRSLLSSQGNFRPICKLANIICTTNMLSGFS